MFKKFLLWGILCLFSLFITQTVLAQFSVSGTITDSSTLQPVVSASISLQGDIHTGSYSDSEGRFQIKDLPEGDYTIRISYLGYHTAVRQFHLSQSIENLNFSLKEIGLFIAPIEITGTRAGENAPFTKTDIPAKSLEKINLGQDLPYLLHQQPALVTTSDAGAGVGYTNIWIRGSDMSRINVTFNGIPVNDAESAGAFFVDIPDIASSVNSIQIQRGVGTSTNGAGAFGATINLSTNTFHPEAYGRVSAGYGSFNTQKYSVKAGSGLLNDHFTIDARLSSITSDGFIDRASSDLKSFYLSGAYFNKKTALRFNVFSGKEKTYQAWNGVPEDSLKAGNRTYNGLGLMPNGGYYDNQTDNYTQTYYQLFWNQELNPKWNYNIATFLTRGKGYYEEYKTDEFYKDYGLESPIIGEDTLTTTDLIRDLWLDNYYYGAIFSLNYKNEKFSSTLGGGWNRYDGKHYGNVIWAEHAIDKGYRYYLNQAYKNDFNIYWKGSLEITDRLTAFLDMQYRNIVYDINGFKHNPDIHPHNRYNFFNPKAGINYQLSSKSRLYASYAVAHKAPNRDDFEAKVENPPKPEELGDIEIGFDHKDEFYQFHANVYYMDYHNQLVLTGKINDVGSYTRTNVPDSYRAGIELNGSVHFSNIFSLSANTAFSRNRIKNFTTYFDDYDHGGQQAKQFEETPISFSPTVVSGASLTATPFKHFDIVFTEKYVSRKYMDNTGNKARSIDPYQTNGLQLHYEWLPKGIKAVNFHLLINNLFDVEYETNGYTYTYVENGKIQNSNAYFPQAGINFLFGVDIDL